MCQFLADSHLMHSIAILIAYMNISENFQCVSQMGFSLLLVMCEMIVDIFHSIVIGPGNFRSFFASGCHQNNKAEKNA